MQQLNQLTDLHALTPLRDDLLTQLLAPYPTSSGRRPSDDSAGLFESEASIAMIEQSFDFIAEEAERLAQPRLYP